MNNMTIREEIARHIINKGFPKKTSCTSKPGYKVSQIFEINLIRKINPDWYIFQIVETKYMARNSIFLMNEISKEYIEACGPISPQFMKILELKTEVEIKRTLEELMLDNFIITEFETTFENKKWKRLMFITKICKEAYLLDEED